MGSVAWNAAADWWAGTKVGTHHEVWAGNTSRDVLTMGYAPILPITVGVRTWFGGPDAAFYNGCAYVPWASPVGADTVMGIAKFTYATGAWERTVIDTIARMSMTITS